MDLKKFLGIKTVQDKVLEYKTLKRRLSEIDNLGVELSEKFEIQKSIISGIDSMPKEKVQDVLGKYQEFLKSHQKEVARAINERNKILKSIASLRKDKEVDEVCKGIDNLDMIEKSYKSGKIDRKTYFNIVKSMTGEPVKYADMIVFDNNHRILILHRVEDFVPTGKVCIPGGHVDPGEDFQTAALRELKEETNLDPIPEKGITYLGEHKTSDAHIKYYQVFVDNSQPVTVDSSEHCFAEFIEMSELPLRPFIFDQGDIVLKMLMKPQSYEMAEPIIKAYKSGKITSDIFMEVLNKSLNIEAAEPLMPESLDGDKKKVIIPVRDPLRCVETIMKGISGSEEICVGENSMKFSAPIHIHSSSYRDNPESNHLTELEIVYTGDENDMRKLVNEMKVSLFSGSMKVRTAQEEFMAANENGTDYVGDPIFVSL